MAPAKPLEVSLLHDYDQQSLRLLELPAEVSAALLDAVSLQLKSAEESAQCAPSLALCTADTTFEIKQVSSSNSLILLRPTLHADASGGSLSSVTAFAKCSSILEALPISDASEKARDQLSRLLPLYDQEVDGTTPTSSSKSRDFFYSCVPYSNTQIETAWGDLSAFETDHGCYRPSVSTCLALWSSLMTTSTVQGVDITQPLTLSELHSFVPAYPRSLVTAFVLRIGSTSSDLDISLDARSTAAALASYLLHHQSAVNNAPPDHDTVLEDLRNLLPEPWRPEATLALLQGLPEVKLRVASGSGSEAKSDSKRKATGIQSRNWHDKFRKARLP